MSQEPTSTNQISPDADEGPRVAPAGSREPGRTTAFVAAVQSRGFFILGGIVALFIVLIAMRSCGEKPPPTQNLGVKPADARVSDPNQTANYVADGIKERDKRAAEFILKNEKTQAAGAGYMPAVTREWEDPLADYATDTERSQLTEETPQKTVSAGPRPEPVRTRGQRTQIEKDAGNPRAQTLLDAMKKLDADKVLLVNVPSQVVISSYAPPASEQAPVDPAGDGVETIPAEKLAGLGQMLYAVMDFEANSDYSNFVQATVVGGRFRGAKFQGNFRRTTDVLEIVFTRANWKGTTYLVSGIATNPDDPKIGLATDVNNHYLSRYGGLFMAAFVRGVGVEIARSGTEVSQGTFGNQVIEIPRKSDKDLALIGAGEVAAEVSRELRNNLGRPPTVIVAANTPIGLLLTADWFDVAERSTPKEREGQSLVLQSGGALSRPRDEGFDDEPRRPSDVGASDTFVDYPRLRAAEQARANSEANNDADRSAP